MENEKIIHTPLKPQDRFSIPSNLDYPLLARQLIRLMRRPLTQQQLSEKLGFSFNQVAKWENGFTQVKWSDFLGIGSALGIPMEKHFRYSFWSLAEEFNEFTTLDALENNLGLHLDGDIQAQASVKKWSKGKTSPDLAEVLNVIGSIPPVLFGWLSLFVDCTRIPVLKEPFENFIQAVNIIFDNPRVIFVNAALQLQGYKTLAQHDDAFVAEHSACTVTETREALYLLYSHGLVHFDGKKYQPWPLDFRFGNLRHPKLRGFTKHATCLAAHRYSETPTQIDPTKIRTQSQTSARVVAISADAAKKVVDLISQFHAEVGEIVKQDQHPKDNVQVILIHSFASNINSDSSSS